MAGSGPGACLGGMSSSGPLRLLAALRWAAVPTTCSALMLCPRTRESSAGGRRPETKKPAEPSSRGLPLPSQRPGADRPLSGRSPRLLLLLLHGEVMLQSLVLHLTASSVQRAPLCCLQSHPPGTLLTQPSPRGLSRLSPGWCGPRAGQVEGLPPLAPFPPSTRRPPTCPVVSRAPAERLLRSRVLGFLELLSSRSCLRPPLPLGAPLPSWTQSFSLLLLGRGEAGANTPGAGDNPSSLDSIS